MNIKIGDTYIFVNSGEKVITTKIIQHDNEEDIIQFRYEEDKILYRLPLSQFIEIAETESEYSEKWLERKVVKLEERIDELEIKLSNLEKIIEDGTNC